MFFSSIRGIFASCGLLRVRSHPSEAFLPPGGRWWLFSPWGSFAHYKLQPCHLPDSIAIGFSLQSSHLPYFIALVSVYNAYTCQTLLHRFHLTAVPLARLYCMVVSLQWFRFTAYHWSDLISLVSAGSPDACQTISWFQFASWLLSDFISLVSACSPATCQIWFIQVQFTAGLYLHRDL